MLRYLVVLLAALVVVLAFIFNRPWLSMGAGAVLAGGLALLAWQFWQSYREQELGRREPDRSTESTDQSLEELGIMEIRKQEDEAGEEAKTRAAAEGGEATDGDGGATPPQSQSSGAAPVSGESSNDDTTRAQGSVGEEENERLDRTVVTGDAPVLGPLMQSLRAVLEAKTVCLLVEGEVALSYRIEVLASTKAHVRLRGSFTTQTALLTDSMAQRSVTVRDLPEDGLAIEDLGYYERSPSVDQVAVAPVLRPDEATRTFLVADGVEATDLRSARSRTVLERYADMVDLVLASEQASLADAAADAEAVPDTSRTERPSGEDERDADGAPRPRRELIAEEMQAVEATSGDLALALVHLNRAESIARRGEEAVASAERLFRARLEQVVPNHRVERFGELTYGIFYREAVDEIEPWVADLEGTMDAETGELEGGVSVGVAVWNGDADAEALRGDAIEALRTAYETGTSTIVD